MKKLLFFLLTACCFQSCKAQADNAFPWIQNIDSLVAAYQNLDIYSGVVLVTHKGEPLYHKAFGYANRENKLPNKLNTHFDIGSMNKTFTQVVIWQLMAEGKLKPEDKVAKYLSQLPYKMASKITIHQLLHHMSGVPNYHVPEYWDLPLEEKTIDKKLEFIGRGELEFEPGTERSYSNAGYVILGAIIEAITDSSYQEVVDYRICKPLQLKDTYVYSKKRVPNSATGYFKNYKGQLRSNDFLQEPTSPDGGFYATAADIQKFYQSYFYDNRLVPQSIRDSSATFAFYKEHSHTGAAIPFAGGFEGANTVIYEVLRDSLSIVVFANMDEVVAEDLGAGILALSRGKKPKSPQLPAIQSVYQAFEKEGLAAVKANWKKLTQNFHPQDPKDLILNQLGYELIYEGKLSEAKELLELNAELFPEVPNCWDSLGEVLLLLERKDEAKMAYEKALALDPKFPSARKALKLLN